MVALELAQEFEHLLGGASAVALIGLRLNTA
jgi:hypothetical protein